MSEETTSTARPLMMNVPLYPSSLSTALCAVLASLLDVASFETVRSKVPGAADYVADTVATSSSLVLVLIGLKVAATVRALAEEFRPMRFDRSCA